MRPAEEDDRLGTRLRATFGKEEAAEGKALPVASKSTACNLNTSRGSCGEL